MYPYPVGIDNSANPLTLVCSHQPNYADGRLVSFPSPQRKTWYWHEFCRYLLWDLTQFPFTPPCTYCWFSFGVSGTISEESKLSIAIIYLPSSSAAGYNLPLLISPYYPIFSIFCAHTILSCSMLFYSTPFSIPKTSLPLTFVSVPYLLHPFAYSFTEVLSMLKVTSFIQKESNYLSELLE